jgi:putative transposase
MRYAFIAAYHTRWPVSVLCEVMQVSRSGLYAYVCRHRQPRDEGPREALLARVRAISRATRHSYGSRRMAKQLQDEGYDVGRYQARHWMRQANVRVERPRRRLPVTTDSRHDLRVAPNVLARQFDVAAPDQAWVGDITYVWTEEGWLYVAVLLDLYSRKVVGWAMSECIDTALIAQALQMALGRRQPTAGLLHHSDRGSQYASQAYQRLLTRHGLVCSMSGKGNCLDNAVAERFFGSMKRERTSKGAYLTRAQARADVVDYIEMFYNSTRKHSYLGYKSPNEYEVLAKVA